MIPEYSPESHTYRINGQVVPGCSTISGLMPKPWLVPWACKMMGEALLPKLEQVWNKDFIENSPPEWKEVEQAVKEAKGFYRKKAEQAADYGTRSHGIIHDYIKAILCGDKTHKIDLDPEPEEVSCSVNKFLEWERTAKPKWLATELIVGSEEHMFAGTLDAVAEMDGKIALVDHKTSSRISSDHYIQTAGYQLAYGKPVDYRMILWLPKTGSEFEAHKVPTPYEQDKEMFLRMLSFWRGLQWYG